MEFVQPIKNREEIEAIKKQMIEDGKKKEYLLFTIGINTGLRISDILNLKWSDVEGSSLFLREKKTGKGKKMAINVAIKGALAMFPTAGRKAEAYIFESESNRATVGQAWTRQYAYAFLSTYAHAVGITERIGTHTMRKTFAYHIYAKNQDIGLVMRLLNHSNQSETLRYIGITQENLDSAYSGLNL